ncbi:hypothetical protein SAMN05660464_4033 [Geodermatophilus dictyosporus]|uniref:Uncharacterized protein n=1 Tax=Geodermatophilus dictyosporus TaxID=1523247 RepID=A0A1I5SKQ3_9ACTN|nr:DUF6069 family protein [Geodermatophilus dictyosporus]SFP71315.1 hypothetical protein SAMN05660464_4033 [Geodermatophilus dictyosporus]
MTTSTTSPTPVRRRLAPGPAALTVLAGAAAAALVWVVAVPLLGADVRVATGGQAQEPGPGAVVAAAVVAGLLGAALLGVLLRSARRPVPVWRAVALTVLVLSLGGPLSSGQDTTSVAVLVTLHLAVAAVLVPLLPRAVR